MTESETLKLNVCAVGDPRSPTTWSGTVKNVTEALERAGHLGAAFDARLGRAEGILRRISEPMYPGSDIARGLWYRYARGLNAVRLTALSGTPHTLHMTTHSLPLAVRIPGQHHYLLCDSTSDLWSQVRRGAPDTDRLTDDADRLERRAFGQLDHVFTTSEAIRRHIVAHYGVPPECVSAVGTGRGGIAPYHGPKDYAGKKLLFVAKDRFEDKGGLLLLDAFRRARALDPGLTLDVVGQSENRDRLPAIDGMTVHGFLAADDLQRLFEEATLFVMPAFHEPWGLVYLEALACRTPVLGFDRYAFSELAGAGAYGYVVEDESAEGVAQTLVEASRRPDELAEKGALGQARCLATFTWDGTARRIVAGVAQSLERHA